MKSAWELARELLEKADNDVSMASIGLEHGAPVDTVCFHIQQAAEKMLKAALSSIEVVFPLTHDLDELLELSIPHFPELSSFLERFVDFAPWAVELRYSTAFYPAAEEARAGLSAVSELRLTLDRILPPESRPAKR